MRDRHKAATLRMEPDLTGTLFLAANESHRNGNPEA